MNQNIIGLTIIFVLIILPVFLVHAVSDAGLVRLIGYCLIATLGERGRRVGEVAMRAICLGLALAGLSMLGNITVPLITYYRDSSQALTELRTIKQVDSYAFLGASLTHVDILTDDNESLSMMYPNQTLIVGHKYTFTLLPNSNFVLEAMELN
jgi:hypothetical protein